MITVTVVANCISYLPLVDVAIAVTVVANCIALCHQSQIERAPRVSGGPKRDLCVSKGPRGTFPPLGLPPCIKIPNVGERHR